MIRKTLLMFACLQLGSLTPALATETIHFSEDFTSGKVGKPVALKNGPHLFLDDYLIAKSVGVGRRINTPPRSLEGPVVTGKDHHNWQPFFTVLHDPAAPTKQQFKLWYNAFVGPEEEDDVINGYLEGRKERCVLGYLESADGVHWPTPFKQLSSIGPVLYDASVIDEGSNFSKPSERYKILYWHDIQDKDKKFGPHVAFSPDGLEWTRLEGDPPIIPGRFDGSWFASYDPYRQRYMLIGKIWKPVTWTNAEGRKISMDVRTYGVSFSKDFKKWSEQKVVFVPDSKDPGVTDWYGCAGFQFRGDTIVAFLQVLRDDQSTSGVPPQVVGAYYNNPNKAAGMGYTVLAWSHDGETWFRDRHTDPYFEPNPRVNTWDHAMSWISSAVPVGDEIYLYYAGYRWGHKHNRLTQRQIGLVKTKRDRYVAREAGREAGTMTTPLVTLDAEVMTVNAETFEDGEVRVQITDEKGQPMAGFAFEDCKPIKGNELDAPVEWKQSLASLRGKPVHLEFSIKNAKLFAFETK